MSGSNFQVLLIEGGESTPPEPACEFDAYYNTGPTNDPYWNDVVALFHFDGNLTDSSSVGATYTDYSTSTTSTGARFTQSLSTTSATTQGIISPLSSDYDLNGGDFTIDLWVKPTSAPSTTNAVLIGIFDSSGVEEYSICLNSTGDDFRFFYPTAVSTLASITGFDYSLNYWAHLSVSRAGNVYSIFCDGRLVATATNSYRRSSGSKYVRIGCRNPGTLSEACGALYDEVRITNGVARYTQNFAFPDTAYPNALETAWSPTAPRTVLSMRGEPSVQQNEILYVPGTANANDTITYNGELASATIADAGAVSYDASGITFVADSSNNYITYSATSKLFPATYYDIVEYSAQVTYQGALSGTGSTINFLTVGTSGALCGLGFVVNSGVMRLTILYRTPTNLDGSFTGTVPTTGTYAIQFNRKTQAIRWLLDGVVIGSSGSATTRADPVGWPITDCRIGPNLQASRGGVTGVVVKDFRVTTYSQEDGSGYQYQRWYPSIGVSKTSIQQKFGLSSYTSPNTGVATTSLKHVFGLTSELDFGSGDFTIEIWAYRTSNSFTGRLLTYSTGATGFIEVNTSGQLNVIWLSSGGSSTRNNLATISLNQWVFFVFQRRGLNFEVFVNGTLVDTVAVPGGGSATVTPTAFVVGASSPTGSDTTSYNGYIDEYRVTKGVARYTTSFTPAGLPNCDSSDPGIIIPTNGTEYPRTQLVSTQQGALRLSNHYQPLLGSGIVSAAGTLAAGGIAPKGVSSTYTVSDTYSLDITSAVTLVALLRFDTNGNLSYIGGADNNNLSWLEPETASAGSDFQIYITDISSPNSVVSADFSLATWVTVSSTKTVTINNTLTLPVPGNVLGVTQIGVQIRPIPTNPNFGNPYYERNYTLTLNALAVSA